MAQKLGKGGHSQEEYDPATGRYVSGGAGQLENGKIQAKVEEFKKFNIPQGGIESFLKEKNVIKSEKEEPKAETLEALEKQGSSLFDDTPNVVQFDESTTEGNAKQIVSAIESVKADFPNMLDSIIRIGTIGKTDLRELCFSRSAKFIEKYIKSGKLSEELRKIGKSSEDISDSIMLIKMAPSMTVGDMTKFTELSGFSNFNTFGITKTFGLKKNRNYIDGFGIVRKRKSISEEPFSIILMNKEKSADKEREKSVDYPIEGGLAQRKGMTYYTAAHELGHATEFFLERFMSDSEKSTLRSITRMSFEQKVRGKNKEFSEYALTNGSEMVAEAFADYYSNGELCSRFNRNIVNHFKSVYNRVFGGKNNER